VTEVTLSFADRIARAFAGTAGGIADKIPAILAAAVVLLITWLAGRLTFSVTRRVLARRSTAGHVDVLVARLSRVCVVALGSVVALGLLGVDLTALAASLGLAGLTLGFALRDVLSNSMSGIMLLVQRPFGIGDTISVAGYEGIVEDVRVRDTVLRTPDGRIAFVPNTTVFNDVVLNASAGHLRRFELQLPVPEGGDLAEVCESTLSAVSGTPGVLGDPAPDVVVASLGLSRARIVAHGWVDTRDNGIDAVRTAAMISVRAALGEIAQERSAVV
jgi:small-conductance mechanosensitive channel